MCWWNVLFSDLWIFRSRQRFLHVEIQGVLILTTQFGQLMILKSFSLYRLPIRRKDIFLTVRTPTHGKVVYVFEMTYSSCNQSRLCNSRPCLTKVDVNGFVEKRLQCVCLCCINSYIALSQDFNLSQWLWGFKDGNLFCHWSKWAWCRHHVAFAID